MTSTVTGFVSSHLLVVLIAYYLFDWLRIINCSSRVALHYAIIGDLLDILIQISFIPRYELCSSSGVERRCATDLLFNVKLLGWSNCLGQLQQVPQQLWAVSSLNMYFLLVAAIMHLTRHRRVNITVTASEADCLPLLTLSYFDSLAPGLVPTELLLSRKIHSKSVLKTRLIIYFARSAPHLLFLILNGMSARS